jgi:hypothetical protein
VILPAGAHSRSRSLGSAAGLGGCQISGACLFVCGINIQIILNIYNYMTLNS